MDQIRNALYIIYILYVFFKYIYREKEIIIHLILESSLSVECVLQVCGDDGITYENECKLQQENCETGKAVQVKQRGLCSKNSFRFYKITFMLSAVQCYCAHQLYLAKLVAQWKEHLLP